MGNLAMETQEESKKKNRKEQGNYNINDVLNSRQQNRPRNSTTTLSSQKGSNLSSILLGVQSKIVTKQLKTCINRFYGWIDLRVIFRSAHRIKSFFSYKDKINRSRQKLFIRLVVGSARIFTLDKQNVDCMTEKLNILKGSQVPVMHLLSQTTSRQLEHVTFADGSRSSKNKPNRLKAKLCLLRRHIIQGLKL